MYAHVIPLTRIPKPVQAFTYRVPDEMAANVKIGHIVRIPWRKAECFGIVCRLDEQSDFARVSPITALAETDPSWSAGSLKIIAELAGIFHVSWSLMALSFSPDIPTRKHTKAPAPAKVKPALPAQSISKAQIPAIQTLVRSLKESGHTFKFRQHGERLLLYRELCASTDKSVLFLSPQIDDAQELYAYLSTYYPEQTILWDSRDAMNRQWEQWQRCKTARIVIATRSGAFLPCRNLGWIVLDQEDRPEHKQWEAAPHYDARVCAEMRGREEKALLLRTAAVPRVETTEVSRLHESGGTLQPVLSVTLSGRDLLHPTILEALKTNLEEKKSCLVICTHKGGNRLLRCLDCQHRWSCPTCKAPLYEYEQYLRCAICQQRTPLPSACPSCNSQNIRAFGAGVEKVKTYLQTHLGAPVHTWDSEQTVKPDPSQPHFLVTTPYACKPFLRQPIYQTVLLFHPESVLFQPDYRANELYYHLIQWHRLYASGANRQVLIQTKLALENPLHQIIIQDNYKDFLMTEQIFRKQLLYPPNAYIIKYLYRGSDVQEEQQITQRLRKTQANLRGPFKQQRPTASYWLVKTKTLAESQLDKPTDSVYNKLVIDVNPHHL